MSVILFCNLQPSVSFLQLNFWAFLFRDMSLAIAILSLGIMSAWTSPSLTLKAYILCLESSPGLDPTSDTLNHMNTLHRRSQLQAPRLIESRKDSDPSQEDNLVRYFGR